MARHDVPMGARVLWCRLDDLSRIDGNGFAWPGIAALGRDLGSSERSIQNWIATLGQAGLLKVQPGKGRSTSQYIPIDPTRSDARVAGQRGCSNARSDANLAGQAGRSDANLSRSDANPAPKIEQRQNSLKRTDTGQSPTNRKPSEKKPTSKNKSPDRQKAMFAAVLHVFDLKARSGPEKRRIGGLARDFAAMGATPEELRIRTERYKRRWPKVTCTPEAMAKHYEEFRNESNTEDHGRPGRIKAKPGKYANRKRRTA